MRVILFFLSLLFVGQSGAQTFFYSKSVGNLTNTGTWGTVADGTGTAPANFTDLGQVFVVTNRATVTLNDNWVVSGTGSKVVVGDGAVNTDLTIPVGLTLTGLIDVRDLSELTMDNSLITHTYGLLEAGSTIEYAQTNPTPFAIPDDIIYGHLILTNSTKVFSSGTTTIRGNLLWRFVQLEGTPTTIIDIDGDIAADGFAFEPTDPANLFSIVMNSGATQNISGGVSFKQLSASNNTQVVCGDFYPAGIAVGNASGGGLSLSGGADLTITNSLFSLRANGSIQTDASSLLKGGGDYTSMSLASNSAGNSSLFFDATLNKVAALQVDFTGTGQLVVASDLLVQDNPALLNGYLSLVNGKIRIAEGVTLNVPQNDFTGSAFGTDSYFITSVNTTTGAKGFLRVGNITPGPTGNSFGFGDGNNYLSLVLLPDQISDFSFCVFSGITYSGEPNGTAFSAAQKAAVVDAVWQLNRNSGTGNVEMRMGWPAALEGATFAALADNQLGVSRNSGSSWTPAAGTGNNTSNEATRTGVSSFSPFGVGPNDAWFTLPVKFAGLRVQRIAGANLLDWSNLTEENVIRYIIERSVDGRNFQAVGEQGAMYNHSRRADYQFTDRQAGSGKQYYRIRAEETSGTRRYSAVVWISADAEPDWVTLFPNPVKEGAHVRITLSSKEQLTLRLFDTQGRQVWQKAVELQEGRSVLDIPVEQLQTGIYLLRAEGKSGLTAQSRLVKY